MDESTRPLSASERLDWLRLIRCENVGPRTFFRLLERFGSAAAALAALPDLARRGGRRGPLAICPRAAAERELETAAALGAVALAACEPGYPRWLAATEDAPPLLYAGGNPSLLTRPMVAVVGARNASINGRNLARRLAADLGRAGLVVASGLARGIDAAAHEGALASGTVAAMAGGLDVVYPPENADLYRRILDGAAAVSEMPPGTQPQASHFPRRNRIVSGLALGVVVVEASPRSGSLITARLAAEQGREVFAVPGSPLDPRAQGPNGLIRTGATLTETADDVLAVLADLLRRPLAEGRKPHFAGPAPALPEETEVVRARAAVVEVLGPSPCTVDEIARGLALPLPLIQIVLLELELAGRLERQPGGRVCLTA
ncbi:MAG: DNA-protecting protein DprA [Magnetospirillum sp.]|nr:DNA-protecting protein DprA [Magnetospirillum sp.]